MLFSIFWDMHNIIVDYYGIGFNLLLLKKYIDFIIFWLTWLVLLQKIVTMAVLRYQI